MTTENFLDELIAEAEQNEEKQSAAYYDLLIMEITSLEEEISRNFSQAEEEVKIIQDWALKRNAVIDDRRKFLSLKLESYIRDQGKKTIDLPHGVLKLHKKPDRVEITDMEKFLKSATPEMLTTIPESVKPDLNKLKAVIKLSGRIPEGVSVIEGKEEFKLSIKTKEISNDTEE